MKTRTPKIGDIIYCVPESDKFAPFEARVTEFGKDGEYDYFYAEHDSISDFNKKLGFWTAINYDKSWNRKCYDENFDNPAEKYNHSMKAYESKEAYDNKIDFFHFGTKAEWQEHLKQNIPENAGQNQRFAIVVTDKNDIGIPVLFTKTDNGDFLESKVHLHVTLLNDDNKSDFENKDCLIIHNYAYDFVISPPESFLPEKLILLQLTSLERIVMCAQINYITQMTGETPSGWLDSRPDENAGEDLQNYPAPAPRDWREYLIEQLGDKIDSSFIIMTYKGNVTERVYTDPAYIRDFRKYGDDNILEFMISICIYKNNLIEGDVELEDLLKYYTGSCSYEWMDVTGGDKFPFSEIISLSIVTEYEAMIYKLQQHINVNFKSNSTGLLKAEKGDI
jgi:hypothetical protein